MVIEENLNQKTIEQIDKEIRLCVKRANKIENGNYILAMLLKDIKEGKIKNIVQVAEWCFEKINIGREVDYLLTHDEKSANIGLAEKEI